MSTALRREEGLWAGQRAARGPGTFCASQAYLRPTTSRGWPWEIAAPATPAGSLAGTARSAFPGQAVPATLSRPTTPRPPTTRVTHRTSGPTDARPALIQSAYVCTKTEAGVPKPDGQASAGRVPR